jgi:hypothetical protein
VTEAAMIISMPTVARSQQRYDHRLRHLIQRTGDVTVATDLGVPRSTAPASIFMPSSTTSHVAFWRGGSPIPLRR